MYENEIWKDIPHYEGLYQVSNLGRVKKLSQERENWKGGKWITPEHIMLVRLNKDGYSHLSLTTKNGKRKDEKVHRLVAMAFIPNPDNLPEVNHKNCIRNDNRVENLEWVSRKQQMEHRSKSGNASNKKVKCIETGQIFNTSTEASKVNGGDSGNIRKSARSEGKYSVYGYHYTYVEKTN